MRAIRGQRREGAQAQRKDRIKDALTAHLLDEARVHGCTLEETRMGELLAVDLELNAQGLEVWL
ncbi:hypothetical protein [uncultured Thiohalocapsa sp.]|uniref:hypothetical protein n=1 Tax=uncultured Thiohalocapsa sp. TaxID=768990 RepID=UPI0025E06C1F|nr:hypothetical protein [uncultured Thiohalocapsa sp.]